MDGFAILEDGFETVGFGSGGKKKIYNLFHCICN